MKITTSRQVLSRYLIYFLVLLGVSLTSLYSYLLFHSIAELFSILIGGAIFVLAWNFRRFFSDSFLLLLGSASLAYSSIDLLHTLSYRGMNIFTGFDANLPTQLWLAARYLQSLSFLIAPVFIGKKVRGGYIVAAYGVIVTFIILSIFAWGVFPAAYIEGSGLTTFKIGSEYLIDILLAASIVFLVRKRESFDRGVLYYLVLSIALTMVAELFFTFYIEVNDLSNLIGHLLKISASYLIYKSIIETAATSIYTDVTQLRDLSAALRESERSEKARVTELEALMDAVPAAVMITHDPDSRHVTGNAAFYELMQVPPGEEPQLFLQEDNPASHIRMMMEGQEVNLHNFPLQIAARQGIHFEELELEIPYPDGSLVNLYGNVSPLFDPDGNPNGAIGAFINITELKQAQEKLEKYAQDLEISNKDLEQFAFVASHDLQEPLRKVISFGERLHTRLSDQLEEDDLLFLERMVNASERMQTMIAELLTYARVTTRAKPFQKVDLNEVVQEVLSDLEIRLQTSQGKVQVCQLPTLDADPQQMHQLFQNLIGNALKFHQPDVPPEIDISCQVFETRNLASIDVKDNGIGFDPQYTERIFRPFERLHGRSQYEGTGMGLAICKRIVDRHNGTITAQSAPGAGTTFSINLPVVQAMQEAAGRG